MRGAQHAEFTVSSLYMRADVSASVPWVISLAEHGISDEPVNPVPITAAPAADNLSLGGTVMAFDIRSTSQVRF